jgi:hypothetical protein
MTPMAAAARCSFSLLVAATENRTPEPMATSYEKVTKLHDAAVNIGKAQTARMKNDPKSFPLSV